MLKELYHGEISPSERKAEPDNKLTHKWLKLSAEFERTLTAEQIEIFHQLSDIQGENAVNVINFCKIKWLIIAVILIIEMQFYSFVYQ